MMDGVEIRAYAEGDYEGVAELRQEAFRRPTDRTTWLEQGQVLAEGGRIRAALRVHPFTQLYGGRPVSAAMVTSVMVAPEARGRGYGSALLDAALAGIATSGIALATLYPSTMDVYRRRGFEVAGARVLYRAPLWALPTRSSLAVEPWGADDLDAVARCYRRFALASNGLMDRSAEWWERVVLAAPAERPLHRYLVRGGDEVLGYVIYTQEPIPTRDPADHGYYFDVHCRELVWVDGDAAKALIGLVAANRAFASDAHWFGSGDDVLSTLFEREEIETEQTARWMARVVDVVAALEARGYPDPLDAVLELTVVDAARGSEEAYRIAVGGGRAVVTEIASARARVDTGALAALFTSWLGADDLTRLGRLVSASAQEVALANVLFAGPKPWLLEVF